MKKALGYLLMIFSGFMLFALATQYIENSDKTNTILSLTSITFIILLFTLGRWLVKRSKMNNDGITINSKEIYFDKPIELNFELTFKEYWLGLLSSSRILKAFLILPPIVGGFNFFSPWILSKMGVELERDINLFSFEYFSDNFGFTFLLFLPLAIFLILKFSFEKNENLKQNLLYQFKEDIVVISGNNFESKVNIIEANKIKITKNQILFFFTKSVINIVPKRVFKTTQDLEYFITVLNRKS